MKLKFCILKCLFCYCSTLQAVVEKSNVNPSEVGDIVVGTVLAPGSQRASECRMAAFYAGFPGTQYITGLFVDVSFVIRMSLIFSGFLECRHCTSQNCEQTMFVWPSSCC